jgi:hypothetical protein
MSKLIYVVQGSHDGTIGVFGNVKGAYDRACEYLSDVQVLTSYSEALKGCKSWGVTIDSSEYSMNVTIYVFVLNQ